MAIARQFTVADLDNFPDDGNRYEVIDGELYVTAAPHSDHQLAIDSIGAAFLAWDPSRERGCAISGPGVIFSATTGVIPDLVWVSAERAGVTLLHPATGRRDGKLHAAPDIVVEVISPGRDNEERDRETKLTLYSRRGVLEYWIVDRLQQRIEVFRRDAEARLALAGTLMPGDTIRSPVLPGFALPVVQVFQLPDWLPR
jgi:Uma2 family endonuclease